MIKRMFLFAPILLILMQSAPTVVVGQVDVSRLPEVTVFVNVTDASGNPVPGLTQDDFGLTEDGITSQITGFAGIGDERPVDIVFVFDTTGSMADEIHGVINTCIAFANELTSTGRDFRLGLVTFGDSIRDVYGSGGVLTADVQEFKGWVSSLRALEGDEAPEFSLGAIKRASQMNFRDAAQVIFILITDAPAHHYGDAPEPEGNFDDPDLNYERTLAILTGKRSISLYAVTYDDSEYRQLAVETGGQFYDIEKNPTFSSIITKIGTVISSQYRLTYITPRPNFDGTRRDIQVSVGGSQGKAIYVEPHLLNVQSDWLVGLLSLLPIALALAVPPLVNYAKKRRISSTSLPGPGVPPKAAAPPPITEPARAFQPPPIATGISNTCPHCGRLLRTNAKFCANCGRPIISMSPPAMRPAKPPENKACIRCGSLLRPDARFCNKCGTKQ
jgi:RNA polymerase subunit RPABC4/transcription elongation factor Spt4